MSSGRVHVRASVLAAPILTGAMLWKGYGIGASFLSGAGCLLGIFLTPDLDSDEGNYSFFLLRKRVWILGKAWEWYWKPYAAAFQHRSFITHWPILATTLRWAYLFWPTWVLWGVWIPNPWLFFGIIVSDACHWVFDHLPKVLGSFLEK